MQNSMRHILFLLFLAFFLSGPCCAMIAGLEEEARGGQGSVRVNPGKAHREKIEDFRQLHHGPMLLLPNAWDAVSARIFAQGGAKAIGTTSAGIASTLGYPDGQHIPKDLFLQAVGRIIASVHVPVSVDLEAGYGETIEEICDTVQKVSDMGAVGINLEDTDPKTGQLIPLDQQVERLSGVHRLVHSNELPLFVNARTDVYWTEGVPPAQKYEETLKRLRAYKEAGADGLFVPGLTNPAVMNALHHETQLPLNVLGGMWITSLSAPLETTGVARVSIGSGIFRAAMTQTQQMYHQFMEGDFSFLRDTLTYEFINSLHE